MEACEGIASVTIKDEELKYDHKEDVPEAEAIILYPSFGITALSKPNETVRLFVLFERKLYYIYRQELAANTTKSKSKTPKTIEIINKSLKIFPWENGKKNPRQLLFPSTDLAESNIRCHLIKIMVTLTNAGRKVFDKDGKLMGLVRPKTLKQYAGDERGFAYLFELEIDNLNLTPGLHDCAWKMNDPKCPANSMQPSSAFPERQDLIAKDYANNFGDHVNPKSGYKISDKFDFSPDTDLPLNNRHPIYVSSKPKLNVGQLTDIHVSSRQAAFRCSQAQVLPGSSKQISPKIGEMVNVSFETFKNLLDQMGKDTEIDLLVLTGDLIDFNRNFDPMALGADWKTQLQKPAKLWDWMDPKRYNGNELDPKAYPFYIDMMTIYSLLHNYVKKYKKPIVMLTGNHEAYEKPYGVSPRVGQFMGLKPEGVMRANDGIPADHNLTTYEASLLYGPAYNQYHETWNFSAKYLEWFYMMFTPLSDFTITYGAGNIEQSFTALEWEDEEQYIENKARGGGTLPRATKAISDVQLELLEESSKRGKDRVLLTHFTIVSYSYKYQITEAGEVNYNDDNYTASIISGVTKPFVGSIPGAVARTALDWTHLGSRMSEYEEGTFTRNRKAVYNMLYDGAFTHVFSGHSHRAGLYLMTKKTGTFSSNVKVQGYAISKDKVLQPGKLYDGKKVRLIVGSSGGPIAGQNHYATLSEKGLANWTLDCPSGNTLKFNGSEDALTLKYSSLENAKPRFAVALSFFNDLEENVFKKFESGKKESEFEVEIHSNLPKEPFISSTTLYVYQTGKWVEYPMKVADKGQHMLQSKFSTVNNSEVKTKLLNEVGSRFFLSAKFSDKHLSDKVGYKQYNYESPWTFPIVFINKKEEAQRSANIAMANGGYSEFNGYVGDQNQKIIQGIVDNTFGYRIEVSSKAPDFFWYEEAFPNEYLKEKPTLPDKVKKDGY